QPPSGSAAASGGPGRDRRQGRHGQTGDDADGGGPQEICRPAEGTARSDHRQADVPWRSCSLGQDHHSGGHSWSRPSSSIILTWLSLRPKRSATSWRDRATPTSWSWVSTRARKISLRRASGGASSVLRACILGSSTESGRSRFPVPASPEVYHNPGE